MVNSPKQGLSGFVDSSLGYWNDAINGV